MILNNWHCDLNMSLCGDNLTVLNVTLQRIRIGLACLTFLVYTRHSGVFISTFISHTYSYKHTYIHIHKQGRYLQQGHFNDQVNEVGQQLLKEVLTACFYTRGWGTYYMRQIWQLPVDHSLSLLLQTSTAPVPLSILPIIHISCFVQRNGTEGN